VLARRPAPAPASIDARSPALPRPRDGPGRRHDPPMREPTGNWPWITGPALRLTKRRRPRRLASAPASIDTVAAFRPWRGFRP